MADGAEIVQIWGVIKEKRHTIFRNIKKITITVSLLN